MSRWTAENAQGFTANELATLDAVQYRLEREQPALDPKSIADALTNAWVTGMGPEQLAEAARRLL